MRTPPGNSKKSGMVGLRGSPNHNSMDNIAIALDNDSHNFALLRERGSPHGVTFPPGSAGITLSKFRDFKGYSAKVSCWSVENCVRRGIRYFKLLYIQFFGSSDGMIFEK